uniref:Uncharacterized protein n=1 Tax=Octopus bimaculoides TaxID=37653 RepID=A0A0L8HF81_OCTBM
MLSRERLQISIVEQRWLKLKSSISFKFIELVVSHDTPVILLPIYKTPFFEINFLLKTGRVS